MAQRRGPGVPAAVPHHRPDPAGRLPVTDLVAAERAAIHHVVVARDRDECVLGRHDLGIYLAVPAPGAVFVEALQAGGSVAEATQRASAAAGTEVDGADFLAGLQGAGLLDPPGGAQPAGRPRRTREIRWIEGVSVTTARRLFGPVAWTCYGLAAVFVAATLGFRPELRPTFAHVWWLADPVRSLLVVIVIGWLISALHEAWHWLAGRAIGVPATFRISYRGVFLAFETDVSQIVTVPRRRRYGVFFAGMALNATVAALALAPRLAHGSGAIPLPPWLDRLLAAVVLVCVAQLFLQGALLFLRTDGYAAMANALRCHDLYRATWLTTKRRLWRLTESERAEFDAISTHDRRVASWFWLGYVVNLVVVAWLVLAYVVPLLARIGSWVGGQLLHPEPSAVEFWESVAAAAVVAGQYALVPTLALRERWLRRRGTLR